MNTPPTMNPASLPMAPTKLNKSKQLNKLDIRPKKLLYNDPDVIENDSIDKKIKESAAIVEKSLKISKTKSTDEINDFTKHIEQNELDNDDADEETQIEHSYNLRRRIVNSKQELKKKSMQKKIVDKENVQLETPSTSDFDSKGLPLSQPEKQLNEREKVIWLQKRRDIGLWIECCNKKCKKWRFVEEYHDPIEVPKKWFCFMNSDKKFSSCDTSQDSNFDKCKNDLIDNKFNAGSIVWGKINGYPWWPAMVDDCPDTLKYYELKGSSSIPVRYHVTFFEKDVSRSWLAASRIKPLQLSDDIQPIKKPKLIFHKKNYTEDVKKYLTLAKSSLPLSITERLEKYSFVSQYKGEIINKNWKTTSARKKTLSRIGVLKSSKKRKQPTKSINIPSGKMYVKSNTNNNSEPKSSNSKSETKIDSHKNSDSAYVSDVGLPSQSLSADFQFLKPHPKTPSTAGTIKKTKKSPLKFNSNKKLLKKSPLLELNSQLSFKSSSDDDDDNRSLLSIASFDLSPLSAIDFNIEKEFVQSKKRSSLDIDDCENNSRCSSPFGGGAEGREINRLLDELIEKYDYFDPKKLDDFDLDDLKKRCNYDQESLTDSDEEEERKWFYFLKSDNEHNSDSSDSEVTSIKDGNKSPKIVMKRIENFDEYLDKAIEELDKVRIKRPSPTPESKSRLKKFLYLR